MDTLNIAFFQEREGQTFSVPITDQEPYDLLITSVKPKEHPVAGWESFTVYFEGSKRGMIEQQTITMSKDDETITLFLVPVEETEKAFVYESIFNLKLEADPVE